MNAIFQVRHLQACLELGRERWPLPPQALFPELRKQSVLHLSQVNNK